MSFQIDALNPSLFTHLLGLSDAGLAARRAKRVKVDANPGYPCRVSLRDAPVGSTVLLLHFDHHPSNSPFRSSHAVYVNPDASQSVPAPNTVPESIATRLISWRAFDAQGLMVDADVVNGEELEATLHKVLGETKVDYVHLHYAKPGCFAASVTRV